VRSLDGSDGATAFPPGRKVNAAFAVWNGSDGQRDGMKSVSQFVDLQISGDKIARRSSNLAPAIVVLVSIMTSLAALGLFGVLMARSKPAS
jgi:hypothetical protein